MWKVCSMFSFFFPCTEEPFPAELLSHFCLEFSWHIVFLSVCGVFFPKCNRLKPEVDSLCFFLLSLCCHFFTYIVSLHFCCVLWRVAQASFSPYLKILLLLLLIWKCWLFYQGFLLYNKTNLEKQDLNSWFCVVICSNFILYHLVKYGLIQIILKLLTW